MRIKAGAQLDGLHYLLWYAAAVADWSRQALGLGEATITSGRDSGDSVGAPRVARSLHPPGLALDLRTRDLMPAQVEAWAGALRSHLGGAFNVVLELDHIHIELAPQMLQA